MSKTTEQKKPRKLYFVWETDGSEEGYFNQYSSLDEAVGSHGDAEIYQAIPRPIGKFKKVVTFEKIKPRKPRTVKRGHGRPKKA